MRHGDTLQLSRCPHCSIANPMLRQDSTVTTTDDRKHNHRFWATYICTTCGGVTLAVAGYKDLVKRTLWDVRECWPPQQVVHESIPERAKMFLEQAISSIHAPSGAQMLTASAVDAMLKEKGLKEGSLYKRIEAAATDHLITAEMAEWAHEVRLDANDQRHADDDAALPNEADARRSVEFATALAQFLFVLPARVAQGRKK